MYFCKGKILVYHERNETMAYLCAAHYMTQVLQREAWKSDTPTAIRSQNASSAVKRLPTVWTEPSPIVMTVASLYKMVRNIYHYRG
jgi:hypothetical protein